MIGGREVDFLIGKTVIEIDGHDQDVQKNRMLIDQGFSPIHFFNHEITSNLKDWLTKLSCQEQDYSRQVQIQEYK